MRIVVAYVSTSLPQKTSTNNATIKYKINKSQTVMGRCSTVESGVTTNANCPSCPVCTA